MELLIDVINITKKYDKKLIFKDVCMKIFKGDSIAIQGHNGSGKSTFLRAISKLSAINKGEIAYKKDLKINYIPEHFPQMSITARTYMKHIGNIDGLDKKTCQKRSLELFEKFYMSNMIDIPLKHLSKGTLQKVGVIQALLVPCDLIMLDEPLSGQDIHSQKVFIDLMNEMNKNGTAILMSCHEKYLINRISNKLYQIRDCLFEEAKIDMMDDEMSILIFEKGENAEILLEDDNLIDKLEQHGDTVHILVKNRVSNKLIKQLLNKGYILRSMNHE